MLGNKLHNLRPLRRTNDEILPVFCFDEKTLFGMRDEHPHFPVLVVLEMADEAIQSAAAESSDGIVENTTTVFNDGARFDVLKWYFHFADGSPDS